MPIFSDRILYEDRHILVVNKLSGELVVRGKGVVGRLPLFDFLKKDHPGLRVVHRLDFETSGVVVFAKTSETERIFLNNKFDRWKKTYRAIVMGRLPRKSGAIRIKLPARGQGIVPAETLWSVLEEFPDVTDVACVITTGRHHQIRRHFAAIRHPLALDPLYGDRAFDRRFHREFGYGKFFLHASILEFPHPATAEMMRLAAPLPKVYRECLEKLRAHGR